MSNKVKYEVEVFLGRFLPDQMKSKTIEFIDDNLLIARKKALEYAEDTFNKTEYDKPSDFNEIPEMIHNVDALSVDVYFVVNDSEFPIYGTEVHDVLTGLNIEAKYFVENNLVDKESLIKILQNRKEINKDSLNPPFILASETSEFPDFDFDVINVLPEDLNIILSMFE